MTARFSPSGAAAPPPSQREARSLGPLCEGAPARRPVGERTCRNCPIPRKAVGVDACIDPRADASIRPYNHPTV